MSLNKLLICFLLSLLCTARTKAQLQKIDTTLKIDKVGFRVVCNNKNADENSISVYPVGFNKLKRVINFSVRGHVNKCIIEDMNDDGSPDLVICIYSGTNGEIGTVVGLAVISNETLSPVYFPDIFVNPKLREGYKGYDEFSPLAGTLLQKFPIYLPGDAPDKPTGGKRTVQYKVIAEQGRLSFKVLRSFDVNTK